MYRMEMGELTEDQILNLNAGDPCNAEGAGNCLPSDIVAYCKADPLNCGDPGWMYAPPFSAQKPAPGYPPKAPAKKPSFYEQKIGIFPVPLLIAVGLVGAYFLFKR